jgi:hypothetical protein
VQPPQLKVPPQPFGSVPHSAPAAAQVVGVHPQTLSVPAPPHVSGSVQLPQFTLPPQRFMIVPQFLPRAAQVVGVQPHTLSTPLPPHVSGG